MTVIERRLYTATGGDSGSLPVLLPGLGVSGVIHRWAASMLGTSGSSVSTWAPYTGNVSMTQPTTDLRPTVGTVSGQKVLRTDGVNDVITAGSGIAGAKTISVLLRSTEPAGTTMPIFSWDGGYVRRGSAGTVASTRIGATAVTIQVDPTQPQFHVITVINDFAGGVGATFADGTYATQATDRENSNLLLGIASGTYGKIEVLDVAVWGRALTQTECQTVRAGFQSTYPGLVA